MNFLPSARDFLEQSVTDCVLEPATCPGGLEPSCWNHPWVLLASLSGWKPIRASPRRMERNLISEDVEGPALEVSKLGLGSVLPLQDKVRTGPVCWEQAEDSQESGHKKLQAYDSHCSQRGQIFWPHWPDEWCLAGLWAGSSPTHQD